MMIQISGKSAHFAQKNSAIKNLPISKVETFLNSNFDLNQIYKIMLTQSHEIWNFNATDLLYIVIKDRINALKLKKM